VDQRSTAAQRTGSFGWLTVVLGCPNQIGVGVLMVCPGKGVTGGNLFQNRTSRQSVINYRTGPRRVSDEFGGG
jgi:hypothetical protein